MVKHSPIAIDRREVVMLRNVKKHIEHLGKCTDIYGPENKFSPVISDIERPVLLRLNRACVSAKNAMNDARSFSGTGSWFQSNLPGPTKQPFAACEPKCLRYTVRHGESPIDQARNSTVVEIGT